MGVSNHWIGIRTGMEWNGMEWRSRYGIAEAVRAVSRYRLPTFYFMSNMYALNTIARQKLTIV